MRYSIFYLIGGETKKYQQNLVKEVGPKFGEKYVLESKLPAHITLKAPFDIEKINELEKILGAFVKNHKSSKINVVGFDNFNRFVAFLKFEFSKSALRIQKEMINELSKINGIEINEYDKKWHPHATISYGNNKKSFDGVWNYLSELDKPKFELMFDNITLMKKSGKYWNVHKRFKLK